MEMGQLSEMGNKFLKCHSVSIIQCDWSRFHCRFILENSKQVIVILDMSSTNKDSKFNTIRIKSSKNKQQPGASISGRSQ